LHWSDEGIVLGLRRQGESSVILELMTRDHGRHLGLVQGGRSRRMQPVLQPGNGVHAVWRARLDEQLGNYAIEGGELRAARYLGSALALYGIATLAAHLRLLPDRDPHPALFDTASILADHLEDPQVAPALFVKFELMLLADLGFGLDLSECAAIGQTDELIYVSPRSGRAVSREAGEPYKAKLFELPPFLRAAPSNLHPDLAEIAAGFRLTGHFLDAYIYEPRGQPAPEERRRFVALATAS
jgi:DNA repair protein RecO (recombination protein O)